jgi:PIN domain nuclease of toxin-antitoxin system
MRVLLDTHAFFWWATRHERLSPSAHGAIADPANEVLISAVTGWELARKGSLGKWPAGSAVADGIGPIVEENGFQTLPIGMDHARLAGRLDNPHRDPFDRIFAAQAMSEKAALVSVDRVFRSFDVEVIW